jgi:hypothetical protein
MPTSITKTIFKIPARLCRENYYPKCLLIRLDHRSSIRISRSGYYRHPTSDKKGKNIHWHGLGVRNLREIYLSCIHAYARIVLFDFTIFFFVIFFFFILKKNLSPREIYWAFIYTRSERVYITSPCSIAEQTAIKMFPALVRPSPVVERV